MKYTVRWKRLVTKKFDNCGLFGCDTDVSFLFLIFLKIFIKYNEKISIYYLICGLFLGYSGRAKWWLCISVLIWNLWKFKIVIKKSHKTFYLVIKYVMLKHVKCALILVVISKSSEVNIKLYKKAIFCQVIDFEIFVCLREWTDCLEHLEVSGENKKCELVGSVSILIS